MNYLINELENIKPKSLFSKIEVNKFQLKLTINKEFNLELGSDHLYIQESEHQTVRINFGNKCWNNKYEQMVEGIYNLLNCKLIELSFELRTYDVWGNEQDGWEINDISFISKFKEEVLIHIPTATLILSKKDILRMIDTSSNVELEWSDFGFNWGYFINSASGKPLGEVVLEHCEKNIKIFNSIS